MITLLDRPEILNCLFHPRRQERTPLPPQSVDLDITVEKSGVILGCRLHRGAPENPILLYFHGNGETVADYDGLSRSYRDAGLNLFLATYRGYGWSTGEPSVSHMLSDCDAIVEFVGSWCSEQHFNGPLFVMGRSLGSACAIDLAYRYAERFRGLIIESGFSDTISLLSRMGCDLSTLDVKEERCFNNIGKIKEITLPTLVIHGGEDHLIPIPEAVRLQAESGAKTKQFQIVPGADHNSLITVAGRYYFEAITAFTDNVLERNTWRQRRKKYKETKG